MMKSPEKSQFRILCEKTIRNRLIDLLAQGNFCD